MSRNLRREKAIRPEFRRLPVILMLTVAILLVVADVAGSLGWIPLDVGWNGFDDAAIVLVALLAWKGYLQGVVRTVFSLVGYVAGAVGAALLSPAMAALVMNRTGLGDAISGRLQEALPALSGIPVEAPDTLGKLQDATRWLADTPAAARLFEENPLLLQVFGTANVRVQADTLFSAPVTDLNDWLAWSLLRLLSAFVLFVILKIAFALLGHLLTMLMDQSVVLGTANRTAGMGLGLIVGVMLVYVLYGTVLPFLGSVGLLKLPDSFTESLSMTWFHQMVLWLSNR